MRKIILGLAVSLDGFIEGPNGEYDWCFTDQDYGMSDFFKRIDALFMGRKTYEMSLAINGNGGGFPKIKTDVSLAEIYAVAGRKGDSKKLIDKIEGKKLSANDYRGMAQVYVALGENDNAFMWLEKSYQHHEESLCSLKIDPKMSPLRNDPRFNSMLRKIGLEK